MTDQPPPPAKPFSFSFSKSKPAVSTPVTNNKVVLDYESTRTDEPEKEFVVSIDETGIQSTKPTQKKEPLVIPLIQNNDWRCKVVKRKRRNEDDGGINESTSEPKEPNMKQLSLDELAQKELLAEASMDSNKTTASSSSRVIPVFIKNRVPEGFEEEGNFDVSARPDKPTLEDYERVPIEEFGMAMLRGMGFKEDDAKKVEPIEVKIRHKGLGLGAETLPPSKPNAQPSSKSTAKPSSDHSKGSSRH